MGKGRVARGGPPFVFTLIFAPNEDACHGMLLDLSFAAMKSAFFTNTSEAYSQIYRVYGDGRRQRVAELTDLHPVFITQENIDAEAAHLQDLEVVFSTWGMPALSEAQIDNLPNLKAVFYAAGAVKSFALPYLARDIIVCSAVASNGVAVAEWCLAQTLLACKGYFVNERQCRDATRRIANDVFQGPGTYGETIAFIGAGCIGRTLIALLKPFKLNVLVVDPFLSDLDAAAMGVDRVELEQAFREAYVVSNHLPNLPTLQKVLTKSHFASMRENATFINTGRGAQVCEADLIAVLRDRPDLTALLDVTYPEPPPVESPFYALPNAMLTSHLAGAHGNEVYRLADEMIEAFICFEQGRRPDCAVDSGSLAIKA